MWNISCKGWSGVKFSMGNIHIKCFNYAGKMQCRKVEPIKFICWYIKHVKSWYYNKPIIVTQ